ncbi:hypothetical protein FQN55_008788 [Onygenales sp. PD_40]|nr:hypothetical protein FQN55_008788 [Onygenales sp. PD_40]KAK2785649.1 hypothetical protein FQN52_008337 [Onygenales sp. PD_12]KAK2799157.1 hypothetical protein FQN51_007126 [Onygenales sp. PD_10]
MRSSLSVLLALAMAGAVAGRPHLSSRQDANPFEGRQLFVNPTYSEALEQTKSAFTQSGDTENAGKVQFIQDNIGTFVWVSNVASLDNIDAAITSARAAQQAGQEQIVGLVLYDVPDRDCSAGESSGEFKVDEGGLERYKSEYIDPYAQKVMGATDLQFAIVLEPDAVANMITGKDIPLCANAAEPQRDAIAYAIQSLQSDHIHLYLDAANSGWLGSQTSAAAAEFGTIVGKASNGKIRGFSINVSNYFPFQTESQYADSLASAVGGAGLPTRFIIDQGRVAPDRADTGQWCNVEGAGFGQPATTQTASSNVDSIVWVKPGGESDGQCGMSGAPAAGSWFDAYAQMLTKNAHSDIHA